MLHNEQIEELICLVSSLDREGLVRQFVEFPSRFPVDLTPDFLETQPLDQLRHIFLALCLQCQRIPQIDEMVAA